MDSGCLGFDASLLRSDWQTVSMHFAKHHSWFARLQARMGQHIIVESQQCCPILVPVLAVWLTGLDQCCPLCAQRSKSLEGPEGALRALQV